MPKARKLDMYNFNATKLVPTILPLNWYDLFMYLSIMIITIVTAFQNSFNAFIMMGYGNLFFYSIFIYNRKSSLKIMTKQPLIQPHSFSKVQQSNKYSAAYETVRSFRFFGRLKLTYQAQTFRDYSFSSQVPSEEQSNSIIST